MSTHQPFRPNYYFRWSDRVPHVAEADIEGNGIGVAIAVVALNQQNKDLYYIRLDHLDDIDLRRLTQILHSRDSGRWALWDLLSQRTLLNGVNALKFFHQFVRVRTVSGHTSAVPGSTSRSGVSLHQLMGLGAGYRGPAGAGQAAFAHHLDTAPAQAPAQASGDYAEYEDEGDYQTDIGDIGEYAVAPAAPQKRKAGRPRKSPAA